MKHDGIIIIDFGSQYAQLIARRVRECGVYCELIHPEHAATYIEKNKPRGIILSGGPETVTQHTTPRAPEIIFKLTIPVLGICYGMQTMAAQLGGKVDASEKREFGFSECEFDFENPLFQHVSQNNVWMSHGDHVTQLPLEFKAIAKTKNAPIAAFCHTKKPWYGVQFHPEVTHTSSGKIIIDNFLKNICHCDASWTTKNIIAESCDVVKKTVGNKKVLLALSGGVDSSVLAALLHQAIRDQLICVFVDTGLLRKNEGDEVMHIFSQQMGIKLIRVNAEKLFLSALHGVSDPEEKRKVIGKTFITIFETEAKKLSEVEFLAQGTIYPDVIESGLASSGSAHVIKSHHNVGGLPEHLPFKLIEPLRELFKDEVRALGLELGLSRAIVFRHPFPGGGLGIRILGEIKKEWIAITQAADAIFIEELRNNNLYDRVSQAFAVFLPVKSVGVKGDARAYDYVIALRAVDTVDFMTASWSALPHDFLSHVSNRILNEVPGVSRVVYDISGKPPATIEWE